MATVEINYSKTKTYRGDDGWLHRDDGPAVIFFSGKMEWFQDGQITALKSVAGVWHFYIGDQSTEFPNGLKRKYAKGGKLIWPML